MSEFYYKTNTKDIVKQKNKNYPFNMFPINAFFIFSMLIDLSNKKTSKEKCEEVLFYLKDFYNTLNHKDYQLTKYENDKFIYRCLFSKYLSEISFITEHQFTHKISIYILGNIEENLCMEFKLSLVKNRLRDIINILENYNEFSSCNRFNLVGRDCGINNKLITNIYEMIEL